MSRPGFNINADGRFIKSDDPASSHMLVSKTNIFSRGQINLWIWTTDSNFYHVPCKEFINGRAVRKFKISKERKGNLVDPASSHMLVSKTK